MSGLFHSCKKEKEEIPVLATNEVTDIEETTATSGGIIISEGTGEIDLRGICWSTENMPTIADCRSEIVNDADTFITQFGYLIPATTYFVRAYARSNLGIGYGNEQSFTTKQGQAPAAITLPATNIGLKSATLNCEVKANYLATTFVFECGLTLDYGRTITPVSNRGTDYQTIKSSSINELKEGTTYHYRVVAVNKLGTTVGNDVTFTTSNTANTEIIFNPGLTYGEVTDIENNTYKTIQIGTQTWMSQNLRTTKFNDGTNIPLLTSSYSMQSTYSPYYIWYNNDPDTYKNVYGALYNFYAVLTDKLCPIGWHVATDKEWTILSDYLGGEAMAGTGSLTATIQALQRATLGDLLVYLSAV